MKTNLTKPCSDCPFARGSLRGWLGPWKVDSLLWALGREPFPCHKTITSDGETLESPTLVACAGAAIFLNNKFEISRNPMTAEYQNMLRSVSPEVKATVFTRADEFREHHDIFQGVAE